MRILIVEDSAIVAERILRMLSELPGEVRIVGRVESAPDALEAIEKYSPDVVILDIRLSRGNGLDVLQQMPRGEQRPIVLVLTNYALRPIAQRCLEAGADFIFDKSTEFEKVLDTILQLMQQNETR